MRNTRLLCGLCAAALGLSLCLSPMTVSALSLDTPEQPSATALSPQTLDDPSAPYRAAAERLVRLGLDQEQIDTLWSRVGPALAGRLDSGALVSPELDYLALPYCREELMDRYLAYGRLDPARSAEEVVTHVNIGLDRAFYTGTETAANPADPLALVNKYQALPSSYIPRLVRLKSACGSGSLTPEAANAFAKMADAARLDGISLRSVSAYRSYWTQDRIYRRYVAQSGLLQADTFSARPGHSEHQTGLALDINVASTRAHFENTREFAWLVEHCAQFGFVLRYPQDKEAVTGYCFEPWHYRYVGLDAARACAEQGLTYDEYIARQPVPGPYQVPTLLCGGVPVDLGHGALLLDGTPYLSAARLAPDLGWSAQQRGRSLALWDGQHRLTLTPGSRCVRDGQSLALTSPALMLDGELYLSLSDLCAALGLAPTATDRGVELAQTTPLQPILVRG